jgi:hypothetical protein
LPIFIRDELEMAEVMLHMALRRKSNDEVYDKWTDVIVKTCETVERLLVEYRPEFSSDEIAEFQRQVERLRSGLDKLGTDPNASDTAA